MSRKPRQWITRTKATMSNIAARETRSKIGRQRSARLARRPLMNIPAKKGNRSIRTRKRAIPGAPTEVDILGCDPATLLLQFWTAID